VPTFGTVSTEMKHTLMFYLFGESIIIE